MKMIRAERFLSGYVGFAEQFSVVWTDHGASGMKLTEDSSERIDYVHGNQNWFRIRLNFLDTYMSRSYLFLVSHVQGGLYIFDPYTKFDWLTARLKNQFVVLISRFHEFVFRSKFVPPYFLVSSPHSSCETRLLLLLFFARE